MLSTDPMICDIKGYEHANQSAFVIIIELSCYCLQGTLTVITFALQSNGTTSTTGGGRRLLDTDMSTSLKVAIAQTCGS